MAEALVSIGNCWQIGLAFEWESLFFVARACKSSLANRSVPCSAIPFFEDLFANHQNGRPLLQCANDAEKFDHRRFFGGIGGFNVIKDFTAIEQGDCFITGAAALRHDPQHHLRGVHIAVFLADRFAGFVDGVGAYGSFFGRSIRRRLI